MHSWIKAPPEWLRVEAVDEVRSAERDAALARLHAGERGAIRLAEQFEADLILLDEKAAREIARQRGLEVAGLLGVLDEAATRGYVDVTAAVGALQQTNFRVTPKLLKWLLDRHR